jgi:hypothetical protein
MVMRGRPKRPQRELIRASIDLLYEIERFFECWYLMKERTEALRQVRAKADEGVAVAFLVHGRSLVNVYFPARPHREDVIASDFFAAAHEWEAPAHVEQIDLLAIRRWVNRDVAHLSYQRQARGSDRRDFALIWRVIRASTTAFLLSVPPSNLAEDFQARGLRAASLGSD